MEQIHEIIATTPPEMKGQTIDEYKARAVAIGRKLDKQARVWYMVYATCLWGRTVFFVAKQGIIQ